MPAKPLLERAISAGLNYLAKQQLKNGGFNSFSSPAVQPFQPVKTYQTNFVPALILAAISTSDQPVARKIRHKLANYLIGQASPSWSFNYWTRSSSQFTKLPYPDDLDDTFCALIALCLHDPELIDEAVLAPAIKLLLTAEAKVGGPYRTWLTPPDKIKAWRDIDIAVNCNVAYFLSLVSNPLPNLTKLIDKAIFSKKLTSPYYPSAYPLVYFAARGYNGKRKTELITDIQTLAITVGTPLALALTTSSLFRLGTADQAAAVAELCSSQMPDGSWPAAAFCIDPAIAGQTHYNGSASLTTALVIEALELARQPHEQPSISAAVVGAKPRAVNKKLSALVEKQVRNLEPELGNITQAALNNLAASETGNEIIRLPANFNRSLLKPLKPPAKDFFDQLSLANLNGWLAYTIYDDFYDGGGQVNLLPAANVALRNAWHGFERAMSSWPAFQSLLNETFDAIDGANAWELQHCRFPVSDDEIKIQTLPAYGDLAKLADRSLGHSLSPLAILIAGGQPLDSPAFQSCRQALRHYLIVRQLNDDVHDWQIDLEHGQISYVVTRLLSELKIKPGSHSLTPLISRARRQFWHQTLPKLCGVMQEQIALSRQALANSNLLVKDNIVAALLDRLEQSVATAAQSQHEATNFLKHYNKQSVT